MASTGNSNGIGIGTVTFLIFLVLKLTHVIDWSWWWVTSPLWISAALVAVILAWVAVILAWFGDI